MVEAASALRNSVRLPIKVSATRVVVTVVPTFAPRMMGMAPRMGNAPEPTAVTAMAAVVVDDWIKTVPSTPTLSPTHGFAAKANMLCAAAQPCEATADNAHRTNQQVDQPSYTEPAQGFGPYGKLDTPGVQRSRWGRSHGHRAAGSRGLA